MSKGKYSPFAEMILELIAITPSYKYENGMKNISVCYIEKREIGPYSIASPRWCPNRDKKRQGEV